MKIKKLKINNLRNVSDLEVDPAPRHNIITGNNGAGKTTLLEAIYLLARAKSFRTNLRRSPIQQGKETITCGRKFPALVNKLKMYIFAYAELLVR